MSPHPEYGFRPKRNPYVGGPANQTPLAVQQRRIMMKIKLAALSATIVAVTLTTASIAISMSADAASMDNASRCATLSGGNMAAFKACLGSYTNGPGPFKWLPKKLKT